MKRDFTLSKYNELITEAVNTNYTITNVRDYVANEPERCIILRHDVDRDVDRAIDMARLEKTHGVTSTYYFRHIKGVFDQEKIRVIKEMGHEIAYHYEVMDKARGDPEKAINIFQKELDDFRQLADVTTACMHGNPLASWANRDLWQDYDYKDFGIVCEPYLSLDYNKILYVTDTGRTWAGDNVRVKDNVSYSSKTINAQYSGKISSTNDVIEIVRSEDVERICALIHPNRWCDDMLGWTKELIFQKVKNVGKAGIVRYRHTKG
jgi:hypothetical protein